MIIIIEDRIYDTTNYTYSLNYEFVENYFKKKEETSNNNQNINNNNNNLSSNSEINSNSEIKNVNKYPGNEAELYTNSHPTAGYTSGRIDIWKRIFKLYDFKKFFGLGAQGDRQILMGEESKFILSSNASNLIIYSFISAGYFGVLSIFIVYLVLSLKILSFFFENKKLFHEYNFFRYSIIFLLIRSLRKIFWSIQYRCFIVC